MDAPRPGGCGAMPRTIGLGSGPGHPAAAYVYSEDRKGEHPVTHLKGFHGLLQVDGYAGFGQVKAATNQPLQLAFCWAHVRRKFYDVHVATKSPIAHEALQRIGALYAIESDISGRSAEDRQRERQQRSRPLIEALQVWLREQLERLSGRSKLAQAIRYTFNHWDGLIPLPRRWPSRDGHQHCRAGYAPHRDAQFIVHLLFKYLETLEVDSRWQCDTGALCARRPPPRSVYRGRRHGSGTARRVQPARREGSQPGSTCVSCGW